MNRDPTPRIPFSTRLARGAAWEEAVAAWLMPKSAMILELFRYHYNGEAPVFIRLGERVVVPDIQLATGGRTIYVEVKSKTELVSFNGIACTGVDLAYWQDYRCVAQETGLSVLMVFVHESTREVRAQFHDVLDAAPQKREVPTCKFGRGGMVFWPADLPHLLARIDVTDEQRRHIRTEHLTSAMLTGHLHQ